MSVQIMTVTFEELESGAPAINLCSEFSIPISNKTFVKSFISYYTNDLKFRLETISGNKLSFKWLSEDDDIIEVYFKGDMVGYAMGADVKQAFVGVLQCMLSEK